MLTRVARVVLVASIFLSHSSKDKPFARRLTASLRARGLNVWLDAAEMLPGDSLVGKIEAAVGHVDYLGVVLSCNSVVSPWVLKEVRVALQQEISGKKIVVIPFLYTDCDIPVFLVDKIYADFRNPENYDNAVDAIIQRVRRDSNEEDTNMFDALRWEGR